MSDRRFPILGTHRSRSIPWSVAEVAYGAYARRYGRQQSLDRLADRGGFHEIELDEYFPGWREAAGNTDEPAP